MRYFTGEVPLKLEQVSQRYVRLRKGEGKRAAHFSHRMWRDNGSGFILFAGNMNPTSHLSVSRQASGQTTKEPQSMSASNQIVQCNKMDEDGQEQAQLLKGFFGQVEHYFDGCFC